MNAGSSTSQHPKCYASALGGCSNGISGEHFFSKGVLKYLNRENALSVTGFPWQVGHPEIRPSVASLDAKILCSKHNSDLSDLDTEALSLFKTLDDIKRMIEDDSQTGEHLFEVSGEKLERWILKALVGAIASASTMVNGRRTTKSSPPLEWLRILYGLETMPKGWGLYLSRLPSGKMFASSELSFEPITTGRPDESVATFWGADVSINGVRFVFGMSQVNGDLQGTPLESSIHHPSHLLIRHAKRMCSARLSFAWENAERGGGLNVDFIPTSNLWQRQPSSSGVCEMSKRQPDPAIMVNDEWLSPERQDVFRNVADRPKTWYVKGLDLKAVAEHCNPKTEFDACDRPWVYTMLLGMSIEALLKAATIYHHGTQIEKRPDGSMLLKRKFTTHKLDELAAKIGSDKFAVSADELFLLKRLAAFVEWCGKYPVPKTSEQMMAIGTSSIEREKILSLHKRLQDHLEQFESTLNDLV